MWANGYNDIRILHLTSSNDIRGRKGWRNLVRGVGMLYFCFASRMRAVHGHGAIGEDAKRYKNECEL